MHGLVSPQGMKRMDVCVQPIKREEEAWEPMTASTAQRKALK